MVRRLLAHVTDLAASRALVRTGRSRPIRSAMIPMTTSNSTKVKPTANPRFRLRTSMKCCTSNLQGKSVAYRSVSAHRGGGGGGNVAQFIDQARLAYCDDSNLATFAN